LVIHAVSKATLFLVSGHLIHVTNTRFSLGNLRLGRRLFLGFVATIIGTLSLSGVPPFPMYWVKSAMDSLALSIPSLGLIVVSLITAASLLYSAFLARFLSLNFIKGGDAGDVEIHGGGIMASAYTALAVSLVPLVYITSGFFGYGLEAASVALGLLYLASYVVVTLRPTAQSLAGLGRVLEDRLYLPIIYDVAVPWMTWMIAWLIDLVNLGVDWFSHSALPRAVGTLSTGVRRIQRGYLRFYLEITFLVLVIAALLVAVVVILHGL
jgi:NADH-quinone oxidoreductase subunit L